MEAQNTTDKKRPHSERAKQAESIDDGLDLAEQARPTIEQTGTQAPAEVDANSEQPVIAPTQPSVSSAPTQSNSENNKLPGLPFRQDPSYQGNGKTKETVIEAPPKEQRSVLQDVGYVFVLSIGLRDHCQPGHCRHSIGTWPTRATAEAAVREYATRLAYTNHKIVLENRLQGDNDPGLVQWLSGRWQTQTEVIGQRAPWPVTDLHTYWVRIERVPRHDFVTDNGD